MPTMTDVPPLYADAEAWREVTPREADRARKSGYDVRESRGQQYCWISEADLPDLRIG